MTTITTAAKSTAANWTRRTALIAKVSKRNALKAIETAGAKAEAERKLIDAELIEALDASQAEEAVINGQTVVKIMKSSNGKIDMEALKTAFPEAFEATYRRTEYRYIKTL